MRRAISFALVGVLNTGLDFAVYLLLTRAFDVPPLEANAVGFLVGSINSYVVNGRVTFRENKVKLASFRRVAAFAGVTILCLGVSSAVISVLLLAMPDILAKIGALGATFLTGFLLSRAIVYRGAGEADAPRIR